METGFAESNTVRGSFYAPCTLVSIRVTAQVQPQVVLSSGM